MKNIILLSNGFISLFSTNNKNDIVFNEDTSEFLGTILSNFASFGYMPSKEIISILSSYSKEELTAFWVAQKEIFDTYFKDIQNAKNGIVYKNFPQEVLSKTESEYWIAQIFMYFGVSWDFFAENEKEREACEIDLSNLKVLKKANESTLTDIFTSYKNKKVALTPQELEYASYLLTESGIDEINISDFVFKMNGALIAKNAYENSINVKAENATDIIRFAAVLAGVGDKLNQRISKFVLKRKERRVILKMLCGIVNYEEDIAARRETSKALFKALRPGDYAWAKPVSEMYDKLYKNNVHSFAGKVEMNKDSLKVFEILKTRPGAFVRAFHHIYNKHQDKDVVVEMFCENLSKLSVFQLLKFKKYILTINDNKFIIARPKSSWEKTKLLENNKIKIAEDHISKIVKAINETLKQKINEKLPDGVLKGDGLSDIKLPSNDQEISIGRGTKIKLADNVKFIRSATYWTNEKGTHAHNFYFDNSWNFIMNNDSLENETHDEDIVFTTEEGFVRSKKDNTAVCYSNERNDFAVFSGDPTIINNDKNCAAQLIDLDLLKAKEVGCKYAFWSVLSYSHINFKDAEKAFGCIQFLEDNEKGKLFEPSKVDMQLSLKGNGLNKFLVMLDIEKRDLIYLDMAFPGIQVATAEKNDKAIRKFLPALLEHLNTIPSVADLVEQANEGSVPFLVNDKDVDVKGKAYVFKELNSENEVIQIDLQSLLN